MAKAKKRSTDYKRYGLLAVSVLLLLIGGVCTFVLTAKGVTDVSNHKTTNSNQDRLPDKLGSNFTMVTNADVSYRATEVTNYNGDKPERTQLMDRDGTAHVSRLTSLVNGELTAKVFSGEVTYSCNRQACQKLVWRDDAPYADNTSQYAYDFSFTAIQSLKHRAAAKGEASCPAGKCLVWEAAPDDTIAQKYKQTLYVDTVTKRTSKEVRSYPDSGYTSTITYDYQPRTITMPPIPQEMPEL